VIIAFITPFYSPPCVRLCCDTDRSIVVFENAVIKNGESSLRLVIVFPNMVLTELAPHLIFRVPVIGATGTCGPDIDTNRTCVPAFDANETSLMEPPTSFPGISHKVLKSAKDGHYRWDVPKYVDHSVYASDNGGTIIPDSVNVQILKKDNIGATFGKGRVSVAPAAFKDLNSVQNIEMTATNLPDGPYLQMYSPHRNGGFTGIRSDEKVLTESDCSIGRLVVIIGRKTTVISRFMTRDRSKDSFAEVTSKTSSD
jgi:hypothetical protein